MDRVKVFRRAKNREEWRDLIYNSTLVVPQRPRPWDWLIDRVILTKIISITT